MKQLDQLFEGAVVAQLDLPEPITVSAGSKLSDAVKAMRESKRGAVVVVGDGIAGIFTEVDYVKKVLGAGVSAEAKVDDFMTKDPKTVAPDTKLSAAFELMSRGDFRHLPVANGKACSGLLQVRHLNQYLAERFPQDVLALPPDVHQVLAVDGG